MSTARELNLKRPMRSRAALSAALLGIAVTSTSPAMSAPSADDCTDKCDKKVPTNADKLAELAKDTAGVVSKVWGYWGIAKAALNYLGLFKSDPDLTNDALLTQLRELMEGIATAEDWQELNNKLGDTEAAMTSLLQRLDTCTLVGNCDVHSPGVDSQLLLALFNTQTELNRYATHQGSLNVSNYFLRLWTKDVPLPPSLTWLDIEIPKPVNRFVYDWRGPLPHYLKYLAVRVAVLAIVDSKFPGTSTQELSTHIEMLKQHIDIMRNGIKCGIGLEYDYTVPGDVVCHPYTSATEYCMDVYSGTYASRKVATPICHYGWYISKDERRWGAEAAPSLAVVVPRVLPLRSTRDWSRRTLGSP